MRRKDREMNAEFGKDIINKSRYGVISMVYGDNEPYGIRLSIVRDENNLYFHSAPEKMDYFHAAIKSGLDRVNVYKIEIEEINAKRKKYDLHGEEIKWGRMV